MCGISGIWKRNGGHIDEGQLARFNNSLTHRGPDGHGIYCDHEASLALGHRRLSILDPSIKGKQPMTRQGHLHMSFNGEIYNFLELKKELEAKGCTFTTETDTEVFLQAYAYCGKDCFNMLNGMWAAAIYDSRTKKLILTRDRYGIKPLFYLSQQNGDFCFASETYAFKNLDGYSRSFDNSHLNTVLLDAKSLDGSQDTIFQGIKQVRPGHFLEISNKNISEQQRWYVPPESDYSQIPYAEQVERFESLFASACQLRLRSDVPLACALSGGLDSSSVYAMVHKLANEQDVPRLPSQWQQAFTLTFPGSSRDELAFAKAVTAHFHKQVTKVEQDYTAVDSIIERSILFDSVYDNPNFILVTLYQKMRDCGIKVSLDGHGVDELLYGYPEMIQNALQFYKDDSQKLNQLQQILNEMLGKKAAGTTDQKPDIQTIKKGIRRLLGRLKKKAVQSLRSSGTNNHARAPRLPSSGNRQEYQTVQEISDHYMYQSFLPSILRNFDRASMQAGVEVRMPFLDYRLVEFIQGLPFKSKVGKGYSKRILRDAMNGKLPDDITWRKSKIGLMAPMDRLFNNYMKTFVLDTVRSQSFLESDHWNGHLVADFVEHTTKNNKWNISNGMKVWPYINAHIIQ